MDNLTAVVSAASRLWRAIEGRLTTLRNVADSKYDSLQLSLRRNESAGLSYLASYTLGKATNNWPGQFPGNSSAFRNTPTDPSNLGLEKGRPTTTCATGPRWPPPLPLAVRQGPRPVGVGGWSVWKTPS